MLTINLVCQKDPSPLGTQSEVEYVAFVSQFLCLVYNDLLIRRKLYSTPIAITSISR